MLLILLIKRNSFHKSTAIKEMLKSGKIWIVFEKEHKLTEREVCDLHSEYGSRKSLNKNWDSMLGGFSYIFLIKCKYERLKKLVGVSKPEESEEGTIRRRFGSDIVNNVVYYSSKKNAEGEIKLLMPEFFYAGFWGKFVYYLKSMKKNFR